MATSSANPDKLSTYSRDGLALIATLRTKSTTLTDAVEALRSSSNSHVPDLGHEHAIFSDLVADWQHLDEFVGQVATGFRQANGGSGVVTVSDADILRLGHVGYADRDEAIAAAQDAQRRLDELMHQNPQDIDRAELDALFAEIARGQYDTTFAVTFSNAVGVEGYVNAMALIRNNYTTTDGGWHVTDEGMGLAAVLGTTLTTALHTVDYNDPANANLAPEDRLSYDFVEDLTSGYHGSDHAGREHLDPDNPMYLLASEAPNSLDRDLSVLLSYTDPPTWLAVDIANHRLSPLLEDYAADTPMSGSYGGSDVNIWGDRSGVVTNYATMLSRNSDASTLWLYDTAQGGEHDNLRLVLERVGGANIDDGQALANVVQNGLTNNNIHESIPGAPSYVEGGLMREELMGRAIDDIGEIGEIGNHYLNHAFAVGVDHNMNVIDERINAPFQYDEGHRPDGVLQQYLNTHDFLRETMRDAQAALDIHQSVHEYGLEQAGSLPGDQHDRDARLAQLGRIQGLVTEAQYNAGVGGALDDIMSDNGLGPSPGSVIDYGISWVPYGSKVNDVLASMGVSVGNDVNAILGIVLPSDYDRLNEAQQHAAIQRARDQIDRAVWLSSGLYDSNTPDGAALRASAHGQPFVNPDGSIKTHMTQAETNSFRRWALEQTGNDATDLPTYNENHDVEAGVAEVQQGETDVRDRR